MTTFQFLDNILEAIKDRGLGMVSKAFKLIFTFKMGLLEAQKLGFWTVRGSFLGLVRPNLTIFIGGLVDFELYLGNGWR